MRRSKTLTYRSWEAMRDRCSNPNHVRYARYGGRGIYVCARWQNFEAFLEDMGERPPGTTLDRFPDTDGHYVPGNCRWATPVEQQNNKTPCKTFKLITFQGETLSVRAMARRHGIHHDKLYARLRKGMSVADALTL